MNWWAILLPCLLLLESLSESCFLSRASRSSRCIFLVSNTIGLIWQRHPTILTAAQIRPIFDLTFPINITQSCLTTCLIAFKITRQYTHARSAGLNNSAAGLLTMLRIFVESAMIFTIQQVVLCILYYRDDPARFIFHGTLVPSIGT